MQGPYQYEYNAARRLTKALQPGWGKPQTSRLDPAGNRLFLRSKYLRLADKFEFINHN
jgi:hypothetical protein